MAPLDFRETSAGNAMESPSGGILGVNCLVSPVRQSHLIPSNAIGYSNRS